MSAKGLARLHEEIAALKALDHPHIVRLREVFYSDTGRTCLLVTDLCSGGELFDVITRKGLTEREAALAVVDMLSAVRYLHGKRILHRDLKPENLLYKDTAPGAPLKVVDFGRAVVMG